MVRALTLVLVAAMATGCIAKIKEAKIRSGLDEIWVNRNLESIDKHYDPAIAKQVRQFVVESQAMWPDAELTIKDIVVQGNTFVVEWSVTGHHRDTGTLVTLEGVNVNRVKGTTVVEESRYFDNFYVYDKLGFMLVPPDMVPAQPPIIVASDVVVEEPVPPELEPEAPEAP